MDYHSIPMKAIHAMRKILTAILMLCAFSAIAGTLATPEQIQMVKAMQATCWHKLPATASQHWVASCTTNFFIWLVAGSWIAFSVVFTIYRSLLVRRLFDRFAKEYEEQIVPR
jgi:hypothetical protein